MKLKEQLQQKINLKTKPIGALGQLEDIALQIGTIQQTLSPKIERPTILVFAADHGLTEENISPYPKDVTWQMVMNFALGGAAINVFCRSNNIELKVVDAGVDYNFPENTPIVNAKIAPGTKNMLKEPAMNKTECSLAMKKGAELVTAEFMRGCNTIGFGEMGIGNTSASALIMHRFLGLPISDCVGAGTGAVGPAFEHKLQVITKVSEKYNPTTPLETLATFGGFEIAMMAGAFLEASKLGMVILVDGFIASAAMLSAYQFDKKVKDHCLFCHTSNEKAHKKFLEMLNAESIIDLRLRLGEGTGAAIALPIIQSAVAFLNEMASFEQAGVSNKEV